MARTRLFKVGDSQAIRIPAELSFENIELDLEVSRFGDVITICPARNAMSDSVAELRRIQSADPVKKPDPPKKPGRVKKTKGSTEVSARRRG